MSSRMMIRSCGSSLRTLLHRHLRPTVAATNSQTKTPASIYNLQYLLPNSIVPRTVNLSDRFSIDAVGYSTSVEADRERRTLDPSKEYVFEEDSDGSELDEAIFEGFTEDEDDDDEGDEDDDDDDAPSSVNKRGGIGEEEATAKVQTTEIISKTLKEGERIVGATRRPDGSLRKPIRIRVGYVPQDEVSVYKSKGSQV
ncbi:hypothetical protein L6452_28614 [Arctium lappa]|uniref:Uncharacterized protein n=1 Tax=Arctium lappa TaxID=4217 RepID=A0ACB8ZYQ7_ARCLA|nr:hypothetical protein L6452_28614 [Arctium lappa]